MGHVMAQDLSERSIAISTEELRRVPEVIAVAGEDSKVLALRAVLRSGIVTTLVTDQSAARRLVEVAGS
jgi:DNA-binding transcriptional regulator LsrR (DeoR family)